MPKFRLPSPAMAVALLALFVALGGSGYAATSLHSGHHHAVAGKHKKKKKKPVVVKVKCATTVRCVGKPGPAGPPGAPGAPGAAGAPGSAIAYGFVQDTGAADPGYLKNATVSNPSAGLFCISVPGVSSATHGLLATLEWSNSETGARVYWQAAAPDCASGEFEVRTTKESEPGGTPSAGDAFQEDDVNEGFFFAVI